MKAVGKDNQVHGRIATVSRQWKVIGKINVQDEN